MSPRSGVPQARWLRPGGCFVATTGHGEWTGTEENWLGGGAPMWWNHADAGTNRERIEQAGMTVEREDSSLRATADMPCSGHAALDTPPPHPAHRPDTRQRPDLRPHSRRPGARPLRTRPEHLAPAAPARPLRGSPQAAATSKRSTTASSGRTPRARQVPVTSTGNAVKAQANASITINSRTWRVGGQGNGGCRPPQRPGGNQPVEDLPPERVPGGSGQCVGHSAGGCGVFDRPV